MKRLVVHPPPKRNRREWPYQGTVYFQGLKIYIENLAGSTRSGADANGKSWSVKMRNHYGEILGTVGLDKDRMDVYLGPDADSKTVYIVNQNHPGTHPTKAGTMDEQKAFLGFKSSDSAKKAFLRHYNRRDFFRSITEMPVTKFKKYIFGENHGEKVATSAKEIGKQIGINWGKVDFPVSQLKKGIEVEHEHGSSRGPGVDVGGDSDTVSARISWAHLKELPDYYTRLAEMEREGKSEKKEAASLPSSFIRMKMREGGNSMNLTDKVKAAIHKVAACDTPGEKIRSKGKGRGLARGDGKGPLGIPIGEKLEKKKDGEKNALDQAYLDGVIYAVKEAMAGLPRPKGMQVLRKLPGSPVTLGKIPSPKTTGIKLGQSPFTTHGRPQVPIQQATKKSLTPSMLKSPLTAGTSSMPSLAGSKPAPLTPQATPRPAIPT